jgi:hypothetical protein
MSTAAISYPDKKKSLSEILSDLCASPDDEHISIGEITDRFGRRSFGALLFIFAIPNVLPLPPGATAVTGAPLVLLAPQVAIGIRTPWLPARIRRKEIKGHEMDRLFGRVLPRLEWIERMSRARWHFMFGPVGDRIIGVVCTLLAIVIILPIPLGNLAPGVTVAVLALALFNRDGVLALIGFAMTLVCVGLLVIGFAAVVLALRPILNFLGF